MLHVCGVEYVSRCAIMVLCIGVIPVNPDNNEFDISLVRSIVQE